MAAAARARPPSRAVAQVVESAAISVRRRCACGGGCPRCRSGPAPVLAPKLRLGAPDDRFEREADRVAEQVMRMPDPQLQPGGAEGPKIPLAQGHERVQAKPAGPGATARVPAASGGGDLVRAPGQPLDTATRTFMEPRFGHDFGNVRVHAGAEAVAQATALQAAAFTVGNHIVFNRGMLAPETGAGKRILAHELTHVVQQRGASADEAGTVRRAGAELVQQSAATPFIARLSAADCSSDCLKEDGQGAATGKFSIVLYADKEGSFLLLPFTHDVGHSWLRLEDDQGKYWTYGFWPEKGYDASNVHADVEGCVHHPDTRHEPTSSQKFELTAAQFTAAFNMAVDTCNNKPKYNLFGLQCTDFAKRVLAIAGQGSSGGFGLIWESPNALDNWIRTNSLVLGTSVTAATSATGGAGSFGLDLTYRNQFYSLLGHKLRLYGLGRAEISGPVKSLTAGAGLELNPQKVWLPAPFVEGGGILGDLGPGPGQSRFGAGVAGAAGLRFNIDELAVIGVEYSVVKDIVSADPLCTD